MPELMTTAEAAEYLRIKERKIYDLVAAKRIPCARVTGKLLFPRHLIDQWVAQGTEGPAPIRLTPAPPIIAGSHDTLLDWALQESGSELAMFTCGSMAGLERFAEGRALAASLHLPDSETGEYNVAVMRRVLAGRDVVLIEWAWRRQGLVMAKGNPKGISGIGDLAKKGVRVAHRQDGSGSQALFTALLQREAMEMGDLAVVAEIPKSEIDLGLGILEGKADAGLAIEAVARQLRLDFIPLARERYDLAVGRYDYFEKPFQQLLAFARTEGFRRHAEEAGGYEIGDLGRIVYNGG
jgi:excisionase family DNA binding protein